MNKPEFLQELSGIDLQSRGKPPTRQVQIFRALMDNGGSLTKKQMLALFDNKPTALAEIASALDGLNEKLEPLGYFVDKEQIVRLTLSRTGEE